MKPVSETRSTTFQPVINNDDLDIPTFLRKNRNR
jgi:hypothetical protein